jgi:hypothetical protein
MPLNKKGKKIKKAMTKQYGKKKGEKVFYAMENSGKLKKVIKAVSGRDAGMGMAGKTGNYGGSKSGSKSGGNGRDPSAQYKDTKPLSQQARQALTQQRETARGRISPSTTTTGNILKGIGVLGFGIPPKVTGRMIDYSPMAFGVPKSTRAKKDITPRDRDGGDGSQTMIPLPQKPIMPIAETPIEKITKAYKKPTFSSTGEFGYTVGFKKGGMLRQGKPKLAKKGWK